MPIPTPGVPASRPGAGRAGAGGAPGPGGGAVVVVVDVDDVVVVGPELVVVEEG
ncbi:MAG TPA: hypothetical protein VGL92_11780 [Acidimicrobiia bacterium]